MFTDNTILPPQRSRGFTLIELLIAVLVLGVLAGIAVPSYLDSLRQTRRADAKAGLTQAAQFLERAYSNFNCYNVDVTAGTPACGASASTVTTSLGALQNAPQSGTANYAVSVTAVGSSTFTVQAAPTGPQTGDTCGNFTLNNTGAQAVSGSLSAADCWQR